MYDRDKECGDCYRRRDIKFGLPWHKYLLQTLFVDNTRPLRLMLAIVNVLFAQYLWNQQDIDPHFNYQFASTPFDYGPVLWMSLYIIHAYYLLKGLNGIYTWRTLFFEGILGWSLWTWTAMTHWAAQGNPGPTLACAFIATIIAIRYPTHWTQWGDRDGD
jgi:hypothetical protein